MVMVMVSLYDIVDFTTRGGTKSQEPGRLTGEENFGGCGMSDVVVTAVSDTVASRSA